jgi:hypothetical protein
VIGAGGRRTIYTNRRIRSEVESLEEFYDYYSGSEDPRIKYHFVAEYGCEVDEQSLNSQGRLTGKFRLSKPMSRGAEHTIRYIIERSNLDDDFVEGKTWVLSLYTVETPTLHERMLLRFDADARPRRLWWQQTGSSSRIPDNWTDEHNLEIDDQGCVEWELADMQPNMHYVISWEY